MALLPQDLRRDIVGCTANGLSLLIVKVQLTGQTEITGFDAHLVTEHKVTKLDIPVNDEVLMKEFQRIDHL